MVGALVVLETEIDSRLLWPGTPSNVFACASFNAALALSSSTALALACAIVMIGLGRTGFGGGAPDIRNEAARDMRGGIDGGVTVDATWIDSERLCPGTLANISRRASLDGGVRGECWRSILGVVTPARRAAARVVRGTMVGEAWEGGISRALKGVRRRGEVPLVRLVREELPAGEWPVPVPVPVVLVLALCGAKEGRLEDERREEERERDDWIEPVVRARSSVEKSEGRSVVGKGGEETKSEAICISADSISGEPMTAFCSLLMP
jgi:hypothetical protein